MERRLTRAEVWVSIPLFSGSRITLWCRTRSMAAPSSSDPRRCPHYEKTRFAGQQHAVAFVRMGQQRKEHFHLVAVLWHISRPSTISASYLPGGRSPFSSTRGCFACSSRWTSNKQTGEVHAGSLLRQFMAQPRQQVRFGAARTAKHRHVLRSLFAAGSECTAFHIFAIGDHPML